MVSFEVSFDPDTQSLLTAAERAQLLAGTQAAGEIWARYLDADNVVISILIVIEDTVGGRASARSETSAAIGQQSGFTVFQDGAGYQISTGIDPNGATADILIF